MIKKSYQCYLVRIARIVIDENGCFGKLHVEFGN